MPSNPFAERPTPKRLWALGGLALIWYAIGGVTFAMSVFPYEPSSAGWNDAIWGLGVGSGLAGSVLLLVKKGSALPVFVVTFVCAILSMAIAFASAGAVSLSGGAIGVVIIAIPAGLAICAWRLRSQKLLG